MITEQKIWEFLMSHIHNEYGVAGLIGNLYAESGLRPTNLQNSYEKSLGMTDDQYTTSVDNGDYTNFVHDKAGYGLAQWTYYSRKQNLLDYCRQRNKSIGDLDTQLEFLIKELKGYSSVYQTLLKATSVFEASNSVLLGYERPANQGTDVQIKRANYGTDYYHKFHSENKTESEVENMSNSSLVSMTMLSPNHSGNRTHSIDRITPHCFVGQVTVKRGLEVFVPSSKKASCNYVIGTEGAVGLCVDEANRSWCTSSSVNDQRAITIECASDSTSPYAFNDKVYATLVNLCIDICKRNGKKKLLWIADKNKSLAYEPKSDEMLITVHRWYANKSCPGDWLYTRLSDLANKVTTALGGSAPETPQTPQNTTYPTVPFTVTVKIMDLNIRKEPKMGSTVVGQTGKGTFTITEVKDDWGKLKSGVGYIYLANTDYLTINGAVKTPTSTTNSFKVKITASVLNVRSGVGTKYPVVTTVKKNEVYTIVEVQNNWGKLKSGAGWISLEYTVRC